MCELCQVDRNGANGANVLRGVAAVFPNNQPEPPSNTSGNQKEMEDKKVKVRRKARRLQKYKKTHIWS